MVYASPKPGEFAIPKVMFFFNVLKSSETGSFNSIEHVFAFGNNPESWRKVIDGDGSNPNGGTQSAPVANDKTSPKVISPSSSSEIRQILKLYTKCWLQLRFTHVYTNQVSNWSTKTNSQAGSRLITGNVHIVIIIQKSKRITDSLNVM